MNGARKAEQQEEWGDFNCGAEMPELRADKVPVYGIWKYAVPRSLKEADWLESALLTSGSVRA